MRLIVRWSLASIIAAVAVAFVVTVYVEEGFETPGEALTAGLQLLLILLYAGVLLFLFARAIRNRVVLSGPAPRGLLLGDFYRKGFWVRLAFLAGLPSSLWHAGAMKTAAFWAFLLARPLIYGGAAFLLSNYAQPLGVRTQLTGAVILVLAGHVLFYGAKRLAAAYAWDPARPLDDREPILFLRSFGDDQLRFRRPWWNLPRRWLDLWSFRRNADEALIDEVAQYGPVVALGMPGEKRVPFGASRYYSSHDDWQDIVTTTAKSARAIVLAAGDTPGVRWEYEMLASESLLDKTLLLFPPCDDDTGIAALAALRAFQDATNVDVDRRDAPGQHLIALLPTAGRHVLLVADTAGASAYITAIRGFIQQCSPRQLSDPLTLPARGAVDFYQ